MEKNKRKSKKKILDKPIPAYRLKAITKVMVIIFVLLVTRIGWIQFVQGAELKELASRQQTLNKTISPKRGGIYDINGKALAISVPVDTISINPSKFIIKDKKYDDDVNRIKTIELQQKVARGLAEALGLEYEAVLAQVQSENSVEIIARKVDKEVVDKLEKWMEENEITTGINIDDDTKRSYPYNNLASHVLGFTGTDSQGLFGVEYEWDKTLKGTSRKNCNNCKCKREPNIR